MHHVLKNVAKNGKQMNRVCIPTVHTTSKYPKKYGFGIFGSFGPVDFKKNVQLMQQNSAKMESNYILENTPVKKWDG